MMIRLSRNILLSLIPIVVITATTGCGNEELKSISTETNEQRSTSAEQSTESFTEPSGNEDIIEPKKFSSIYELFEYTDVNWNKSEEYNAAINAYDAEQVSIISEGKKRHGDNASVHCSVAYIDNDDIPEMLVCYESHHVDGICIYTYDVDTDKVIYCGEFSSYGFFSYSERNNVIVSSYGNQGYFMVVYSAINDGKAVFLDAMIANNGLSGGENGEYYHGFGVPDWYDGTREAIDKFGDYEEIVTEGNEEDFEISEDEYDAIKSNILKSQNRGGVIYVNYSNLDPDEYGKGTMYEILEK